MILTINLKGQRRKTTIITKIGSGKIFETNVNAQNKHLPQHCLITAKKNITVQWRTGQHFDQGWTQALLRGRQMWWAQRWPLREGTYQQQRIPVRNGQLDPKRRKRLIRMRNILFFKMEATICYQNINTTKGEERLGKCSRLKETWQPNASCNSALDCPQKVEMQSGA